MKLLCFILLLSSVAAAQSDEDSPIRVLEFSWSAVRIEPPKAAAAPTTPMRAVIPENKNFQRNARQQQSPGWLDPNEHTIDGRSAKLDMINHEANASKHDPKLGFSYKMKVRNDFEIKSQVVFLEYQFVERAKPSNVVRRQFLCVARLKTGETADLIALSLKAPSDTIDIESLASGTEKLFDEKVRLNRAEFEGGAVMQRHDWKYADHKKNIEAAVAAPWGRETCRAF